jgi:hypothetical protein
VQEWMSISSSVNSELNKKPLISNQEIVIDEPLTPGVIGIQNISSSQYARKVPTKESSTKLVDADIPFLKNKRQSQTDFE